MPSSTFHLVASGKRSNVRIERTGGNLDHYYHFIMDMAWPLHHWVETSAGGWDGLQRLYTREERPLYFAKHVEQMLGRALQRPGLITRVATGMGLAQKVELVGFNSRVRDHLRTFKDLHAFRASKDAFVARVARNVGAPAPASGMGTVLLIERASSRDDRGASRRNIRAHDQLASRLTSYCADSGMDFCNLRMESLTFREQFMALRRGRTVLIGQHGAGLLNGLWMDAPGSAVLELAGVDNPTHFGNLFTDLGVGYRRIDLPVEGVYGKQQTLLVDPDMVLESLKEFCS